MLIGTRESKLAVRQTDIFIEALKRVDSGIGCTVRNMKSLGDIDQVSPLNMLDDIGAFVRELDDALMRGDIDVSVNSMKDIPILMSPRLTIGAVLPRDDVRDVCLPCPLEDLPEGAVVGTSSVRREHIIRDIRPDLRIKQIRGNIHTRLGKLDAGEYDAIILAKAGLDRMGIERPMSVLDKSVFVPAPAQGTIAAECRSDDAATIGILGRLNDPRTASEVTAERYIMKRLGAGCSSPVGINAEIAGGRMRIRAVSFAGAGEPVRVDITTDADPEDERLDGIADILEGRGLIG